MLFRAICTSKNSAEANRLNLFAPKNHLAEDERNNKHSGTIRLESEKVDGTTKLNKTRLNQSVTKNSNAQHFYTVANEASRNHFQPTPKVERDQHKTKTKRKHKKTNRKKIEGGERTTRKNKWDVSFKLVKFGKETRVSQ
jgi:hypothetical protein